ncbi:MAG TPA: cysteine desulfurase [Microscillaceae bacterium]|nr:cysteine desulfurase [Microscillaceae bacterium]
MSVYFDNAATTPLAPEVLDAMLPYMKEHFGNPSSIHTHGRKTKSALEKARKKVAELLNTSPSEIFFTSGGTEADNFAITRSIDTFGLTHAITSPLEHHAVLHTLEHLEKTGKIKLSLLNIDDKGNLDYDHLQELLKSNPRSLVSIMHGNNEIGNLSDMERIGEMCKEYDALYHSDTVQTMGHYVHDLQKLKVDFLVGSAHKFHGPKGIGFLYVNADSKIRPMIHGGAQERNMRGGTENLYGIIGLATALELAYQEMAEHRTGIEKLKSRMIEQLKQKIAGIDFNGESADLDKSLYTVLNVCLPPNEGADMLVFNLDISQISASAGSACSSGSDVGSHVLRALNRPKGRGAVRFSFSRYNTVEEVDYVVEKLAEMYSTNAVIQ